MKKTTKIILGIIITIITIIIIVAVAVCRDNKTNILDFRDKKGSIIAQNKEFFDYTFQTNEWIYTKEEFRENLGWNGDDELLCTNYLIKYEDKDGKERELEFNSMNATIKNDVRTEIEEIVQEEIEEVILEYEKEEIELSTLIWFNDDKDMDILSAENGVKLYDVYEFLEREAKKENLAIQLFIYCLNDETKWINFKENEEELKEKIQEKIIEKVNGGSVEIQVEIKKAVL